MSKVSIGIFFILLFVLIVMIPGRHSTEALLSTAVHGDEFQGWSRPFLKPLAVAYLKNVRQLDGYSRENRIPPLQFVLGGCSGRLPADEDCRNTIDWLLGQGEKMNDVDQTSLGVTVLHASVLDCDLGAVSYFLSKGADPKVVAVGEKFRGQTALQILPQVKSCPDSAEISKVLAAAESGKQ